MPLPRSSFRTWFSRALQWIPRQRQNKHCSNRLQISDGDQLLHNHLVINPCPNRKAGETKLVSTGELLETWLRYRETTNKPLLFRRALRKASALRATLSWNLTCKNTSLKRENATEKGSIGKELLHRNRARLSQLTKLYLLFSNNWLTRQECHGFMHTASGNYFSETREEKRGDCNKAPAWSYRNPTFYL